MFLATSNREINGWDFLAQDLDDRIVEVVARFDYEALVPRPIREVFLEQLAPNRRRGCGVPPTCAHRRERALEPRGGRGVVQLFDAHGRVVTGADNLTLPVPGLLNVGVAHLASGVYVLRLELDGPQALPVVVSRR